MVVARSSVSARLRRVLGDTGVLKVVARTRRGGRLFDPADVAALKLERKRRRQRVGAAVASARSGKWASQWARHWLRRKEEFMPLERLNDEGRNAGGSPDLSNDAAARVENAE
jgi:hypothetical protein